MSWHYNRRKEINKSNKINLINLPFQKFTFANFASDNCLKSSDSSRFSKFNRLRRHIIGPISIFHSSKITRGNLKWNAANLWTRESGGILPRGFPHLGGSPIRWHREEGGEGRKAAVSRKCRNSLRRGHNTRNFGISTGGCVTAQWNTLNGMRVPKANKVCYRLLHLGIRVCRSIHACNPFQIICIVFQILFQRLIFLGESGDESIDVRVGTDTKMFIE